MISNSRLHLDNLNIRSDLIYEHLHRNSVNRQIQK